MRTPEDGYLFPEVWAELVRPPAPVIPESADEALELAKAHYDGWIVNTRIFGADQQVHLEVRVRADKVYQFEPGTSNMVRVDGVVQYWPEDVVVRWTLSEGRWEVASISSQVLTPSLEGLWRPLPHQLDITSPWPVAMADDLAAAAMSRTSTPKPEQSYAEYAAQGRPDLRAAAAERLEELLEIADDDGLRHIATEFRDHPLVGEQIVTACLERAFIGAPLTPFERSALQREVYRTAPQSLYEREGDVAGTAADVADAMQPGFAGGHRDAVRRAAEILITNARIDLDLAGVDPVLAAQVSSVREQARVDTGARLHAEAFAHYNDGFDSDQELFWQALDGVVVADPSRKAEIDEVKRVLDLHAGKRWPDAGPMSPRVARTETSWRVQRELYPGWIMKRRVHPDFGELLTLTSYWSKTQLMLMWDNADGDLVFNTDQSRMLRSPDGNLESQIGMTLRQAWTIITDHSFKPPPSRLLPSDPLELSDEQKLLLFGINHADVTDALGDPDRGSGWLFNAYSRPGPPHRELVAAHPHWAGAQITVDTAAEVFTATLIDGTRITLSREEISGFATGVPEVMRDELLHAGSRGRRRTLLAEVLDIDEIHARRADAAEASLDRPAVRALNQVPARATGQAPAALPEPDVSDDLALGADAVATGMAPATDNGGQAGIAAPETGHDKSAESQQAFAVDPLVEDGALFAL